MQASSPQGRFAEGAAVIDGTVLEATDAWGKHLFHRYAGDVWLHVHLGLYGTFVDGAQPAPEPRGALRLRLQSDQHWLDLRGATACELLTPQQRRDVLARLGPDPLRPRADPGLAAARLLRSRVPVAALLMDQAVVAGIGNVYRAELLFRHGVSPFLPGLDLGPERWQAMWVDLVALMRAGVRTGRIVTTLPEHRERRSPRVAPADAHYVYRRHGLPCRVCGAPVARRVLAGRNLYWCPACQT